MIAASGAGASASIQQQLNSSSDQGSFNIASIMANGASTSNSFRRFHQAGNKRDSSRNSSGLSQNSLIID